jgi:hypothetical protein
LVSARDAGKPRQISDNATVNIDVVRNENAPRFASKVYSVRIEQNLAVNSKVTDVNANDQDIRVNII